MSPEAVRYLITAVNQHLDAFRITQGEARRHLEQGLQQVEEELRNVERAILAGVVSETTAALVQDREAQGRSLKERLVALDARRGPGRADDDTVTAHLARLVLPGARRANYLHIGQRKRADVLSGSGGGEGARNNQKPGVDPGF